MSSSKTAKPPSKRRKRGEWNADSMVAVIANRPPGTKVNLVEVPECKALLHITCSAEIPPDAMNSFARQVKKQLPENVMAIVTTDQVKFEMKAVPHEGTQEKLDRIETALDAQGEFNKAMADAIVNIGHTVQGTTPAAKGATSSGNSSKMATLPIAQLRAKLVRQPKPSKVDKLEKIILKVQKGESLTDAEEKFVDLKMILSNASQ